ncbi:MAG TPA: transglycosylase SLT domain-containing protein [bacterium]|nr:transglycosylase SLT domain-containing protein [bacterium]HPN43038.1 transglycosylase SLT domain-containing protein [bacterium]
MTRTSDKKKFQFNGLFILLLGMIFSIMPLHAGENFPRPPEIQDNVDFWVYIYSIYTQNDVVIHDAEHLDIVYQVINLNDYSSPDTGPRERWKTVTSLIREYREILGTFARKDHIDYDQLTDQERHVYLLWLDSNDPDKYSKAQVNIRGQRGLTDNFKAGLQRSGKFIPEFKRIFKSYQLPEELCYLPHVESSFTNFAFSKSGAAGLWQFIRSTGRLYLKINNVVDERLDPYAATDAAARLLRHNYQELESWPLAITAYNHGVNGMARARRQFGADNFGNVVRNYKSRSFGFASRNFYAEFLAATWVVQHCHYYFDSLAMEQPEILTGFILPENMNINKLAERLSLPCELIKEYNPALRAPVIHAHCDIPVGFNLRLPHIDNYDPRLAFLNGVQPPVSLVQADLPEEQQKNEPVSLDTIFYLMPEKEISITDDAESYWTYNNKMVEPGKNFQDVLYSFSENPFTGMLDTTLALLPGYQASLLAWLDYTPDIATEQSNSLPQPGFISAALAAIDIVPIDTIIPGLPVNCAHVESNPQSPAAELTDAWDNNSPEQSDLSQNSYSLVVAGGEIYGPELPSDYSLQSVGTQDELAQVFNFNIFESHWIRVLPEETLGHYADWLRVSAQYLRIINRLHYRQEIKVGQQIKLAFNQVSEEEFNRKRIEFHQVIRNQLFNAYHITGTTVYEIQPGDNIWKICNQKFNIPYWLIAYYNQNVKWNLLKPGDSINIPIINPYTATPDNHFDG